MRIRHPPGRSGRIWLVDRLAVAERAADVLARKQRALGREDQRLAVLAERSGATWNAAVAEAEEWQRRAMLLGARSELPGAAHSTAPAVARVRWLSAMGVEYPGEVHCELPEPVPVPGTPALGEAASAYRRALDAAVQHAAVTDAQTRVRAELATTRQRLRAVRDRWIPALHEALAVVELRLDEHEREELTRTRFGSRR